LRCLVALSRRAPLPDLTFSTAFFYSGDRACIPCFFYPRSLVRTFFAGCRALCDQNSPFSIESSGLCLFLHKTNVFLDPDGFLVPSCLQSSSLCFKMRYLTVHLTSYTACDLFPFMHFHRGFPSESGMQRLSSPPRVRFLDCVLFLPRSY